MRKAAYLLLLMVAESAAVVRAYSVAPVRSDWSGWTGFQDTVSEVITVAFDLPITASLFCGSPGAGGGYNVSIRTYPGDVQVAHGEADNPGDHAWAACSLYVDRPDSFIKGRKVEVRWTRGGSEA